MKRMLILAVTLWFGMSVTAHAQVNSPTNAASTSTNSATNAASTATGTVVPSG